MPRLTVSPFQPGQEALIADIHNRGFEEWTARLGELYDCRPMKERDITTWDNDLSEAVWIAYLDDEPAGYIHSKLETNVGFDTFLNLYYEVSTPDMGQSRIAVLPECRRRGVATALIERTIEDRQNRVNLVSVNAYAYSDNHAAAMLLSGLGFVHRERFYYDRYSRTEPYAFDAVYAELDLRNALPNLRLNPDVIVRAPRESDLEVMVRVFAECSPWVYGAHPPIEEVLAWLRDPWGEVTLVAEYAGVPVGAMEFSSTGRIGVPGVLPEYRTRGIGTTLFYHLLKSMQERGHDKAVADTGVMQQDAISMYHRLGFHIARRLWAWVRPL